LGHPFPPDDNVVLSEVKDKKGNLFLVAVVDEEVDYQGIRDVLALGSIVALYRAGVRELYGTGL
jgi:hypothetical protein